MDELKVCENCEVALLVEGGGDVERRGERIE